MAPMANKLLVYVASPLCSEAERVFNLRLKAFLLERGMAVYLPQEDGGQLSDLVRQAPTEEAAIRKRLFSLDCDAVRKCDFLLAVLDGRTIDEGVCFELGMAFTLGKRCIGFKTDSRSAIRGHDNLMIEQSLIQVLRTWPELDICLCKML